VHQLTLSLEKKKQTPGKNERYVRVLCGEMYWRVENGGALLIAMAFIKANNFKLKFIARRVYIVPDILSVA
jgi:hypothetical protein